MGEPDGRIDARAAAIRCARSRAVACLRRILAQSHRTVSIIGALAAVARPLYSFDSYAPTAAAELMPLLERMLPAIDLNDPTKPFGAFNVRARLGAAVPP